MLRSIDLQQGTSTSLAHVPVTAAAFFPTTNAVKSETSKDHGMAEASPRISKKGQRAAKSNRRSSLSMYMGANTKHLSRRMMLLRRASLESGMMNSHAYDPFGAVEEHVQPDLPCDPMHFTGQHWVCPSQDAAALSSLEDFQDSNSARRGYMFASPFANMQVTPQLISGYPDSGNGRFFSMQHSNMHSARVFAPTGYSGATTGMAPATPNPSFPSQVPISVPAICSPLDNRTTDEAEDDISSFDPSIFDEDLNPNKNSSIEMPRLDEFTSASSIAEITDHSDHSDHQSMEMEQQRSHQAVDVHDRQDASDYAAHQPGDYMVTVPTVVEPSDIGHPVHDYNHLPVDCDFIQPGSIDKLEKVDIGQPATVCRDQTPSKKPSKTVGPSVQGNSSTVKTAAEASLQPSKDSTTPKAPKPAGAKTNTKSGSKTKDRKEPEARRFLEPTDRDVIMGRGAKVNSHLGNRKFRHAREMLQDQFLMAELDERHIYAHALVRTVHRWGGRFLEQDKATGNWYEISSEKARVKAMQALRDGKMSQEDRNRKQQKYREEQKALRMQQQSKK